MNVNSNFKLYAIDILVHMLQYVVDGVCSKHA